jgi:hypothetical protein
MKLTINLVLRAAVVLILASAIAPHVNGQQTSTSSQQSRRSQTDTMQRDLQRHDLILRALEEEVSRPVTRQQPQLAFAQISEDFMRIQVLNNSLALMVSRGGPLDLKLVIKSAAEIRKRAARLKDNLALPAPEKDSRNSKTEIGEEPEQLKASLSALDELVLRFVGNPGFQSVNVVDAQLSVQARRDLEGIIALSDQVRKSSEKLNKVARKPQ